MSSCSDHFESASESATGMVESESPSEGAAKEIEVQNLRRCWTQSGKRNSTAVNGDAYPGSTSRAFGDGCPPISQWIQYSLSRKSPLDLFLIFWGEKYLLRSSSSASYQAARFLGSAHPRNAKYSASINWRSRHAAEYGLDSKTPRIPAERSAPIRHMSARARRRLSRIVQPATWH